MAWWLDTSLLQGIARNQERLITLLDIDRAVGLEAGRGELAVAA